ncbi:MAG: membrane dipeptidase [Ruminococcus sp.]|nr:membrane dipeptidase [Ruminococcus sp.]
MGFIDMHCDTISKILHSPAECSLMKNDLCVDIEKLKKSGSSVQYFANFIFALTHEMKVQNISEEKGNEWFAGFGTTNLAKIPVSEAAWDMAWEEALMMIARLKKEACDELKIITSCGEIEDDMKRKVLSGIATIEEGGILNGKIERVEELYRQGIRLITLTWNFENSLGFPNNFEDTIMQKGLKPFGIEVVEKMNELGMLVDVSHLSEGGFWDCIKYSKAPIVASHSNARALCSHPRNLTDEMLKALAENGGVTGLNFYPAFLVNEGLALNADIAKHALHMIHVAGEDVVAIGTDFDGFDGEAEKGYVSNIGEMEKVWDAFKKVGITERQIDKICFGNTWRVMKDVIK